MIGDLFNLVPERVNFESFWEEIRKRNKWLIQLRYFAFLLLLSFAVSSLVAQYFYTQIKIESTTILIISFCILFYNVLFHILWYKFPEVTKKIKIHSLHFSLLQIIVDLIFLIILIYYTGGVESPFNTFFVFHVIIGSLILPGSIIGLIMGVCILVLIFLASLELKQIIPHYLVQGIIKHPLYNEPIYLIVFFTTLTIVVFVSIYLANSIARVLYQREKELNVAYKELQEAEKAKSRYVMTIVHDLKTPINASLTWVNIIANNEIGPIPEYLQNPIERIRARLSSAIDLINDVLKISQIKLTGEVRKEPINLRIFFQNLLEKHRILILSKNINFIVKANKEDVIINSDIEMLNMVFSNIVSNAIKYNEKDGIIEININEKERMIEISVADNGIGIPEDEISKVFNEFYRSSISKEKNIEGTGLGLALVKEILTKLGGTILIKSPSYLASEGRRGTQVIVTLPK